MKVTTLMMTALLSLPGLAFPIHASTEVADMKSTNDYETKWCRDASYILNASIQSAYNAETFEQEIAILKRGINKTLETLNPKFTHYLESTLVLALRLEGQLLTAKDKSIFLRRHVSYALDDLYFFDGRFGRRYSQDDGSFAKKVLVRVLDEALRAKTDSSELLIMNAGASSVIQILAESDYRRSLSNACAVRFLKEAMNFDDVFYKRDLVNQALDSLSYGCKY